MSRETPPAHSRSFLLRPGVVVAEVAFVVLLLLGIVLSLRQSVVTNEAGEAPLPGRIADLALEGYAQGEEALASMSQLHVNGITLTDGYIGHYEDGAIVWVGIATDEEQAREMLRSMTESIVEGGAPFSAPTATEMDGETVYMLLDEGGQQHFYFQTGRAVVWVKPPASNADAFLHEALRLLPG